MVFFSVDKVEYVQNDWTLNENFRIETFLENNWYQCKIMVRKNSCLMIKFTDIIISKKGFC